MRYNTQAFVSLAWLSSLLPGLTNEPGFQPLGKSEILYRFQFKLRHLTLRKPRGWIDRKSPYISNIRALTIVQPRGISLCQMSKFELESVYIQLQFQLSVFNMFLKQSTSIKDLLEWWSK